MWIAIARDPSSISDAFQLRSRREVELETRGKQLFPRQPQEVRPFPLLLDLLDPNRQPIDLLRKAGLTGLDGRDQSLHPPAAGPTRDFALEVLKRAHDYRTLRVPLSLAV